MAGDFPPASHDVWLKLVDKILDGASYEKKLVSRTHDGIALQPLYTQADWKAANDASGLPGGAPFTRGSKILSTAIDGWDVRQLHAHPDPATVNSEILADLERGVSSIVLRIDPTGMNGTAIRNLADLDRALENVYLDFAPVVLEVVGPPLPYAAMLLALLEQRVVEASIFAGNLGFDPLSVLATHGQIMDLGGVYARLADGATYIANNYPNARAINVNTAAYHAAGAAEAQEIGCALASAVAYLRALTAGGLSIDAAVKQVAFTITMDADFFLGICKLRALRKTWARVTEVCGANIRTAPITVCTAPRMMSRRDPLMNILRTTVGCFAAGVGGADAITVLPFDAALGLPTELSRRIARNTQVVLQEEANLTKVIDPAGGAWMFEKLTDDLAAKGWEFFQEIEKHGGMSKALEAGFVQSEIAAVQAERAQNMAMPDDAPSQPNPARAATVDNAPESVVPAFPAAGGGAFMSAVVKAAARGASATAILKAAGADAVLVKAPPLPSGARAGEPHP